MELKEEIANVVSRYAENKRSVDEFYINKMIGLLVDYYGVEDYVTDAYLADLNGEYLCAYDFYEKRMFIDYDDLYSMIVDKVLEDQKDGILSNKDYTHLKINMLFLESIAHEIVHAKQYQRVDKRKKSLEKDLLSLSFEGNLLIKKAEKEKRKLRKEEINFITSLGKAESMSNYYNALPAERMARIDTSLFLKDISNIMEDNKLSTYFDLKQEEAKFKGYNYYNCPSAQILTYHNRLKNILRMTKDAEEEDFDLNMLYYEEIAQKMDLRDEDRFYYGLLVDDYSLNNQVDRINSLVRKLKN